MIRFSLRCDDGHGFESWFRDNASFEAQEAAGLVECPICGSPRVEKSIMAPHVARSDRQELSYPRAPDIPYIPDIPDIAMGAGTPGRADVAVSESINAMPPDKAMRDLVRAFRRHVTETADHVGDRFADQALKMHHGEIEHRPIYGRSTLEDARMLKEEGVPFQPLPVLPDDRN